MKLQSVIKQLERSRNQNLIAEYASRRSAYHPDCVEIIIEFHKEADLSVVKRLADHFVCHYKCEHINRYVFGTTPIIKVTIPHTK
jgi:hypothetical protein